jgi:uncharacterized repeat protein (TIGR04076 family)
MAKTHSVRIRVVSQAHRCPNGHKVGDEWIVRRKTPGGMCMGAFSSLLPYLTTLRFGGAFPWEKEAGRGTFACPDHEACTVFELERLGEVEQDESPAG